MWQLTLTSATLPHDWRASPETEHNESSASQCRPRHGHRRIDPIQLVLIGATPCRLDELQTTEDADTAAPSTVKALSLAVYKYQRLKGAAIKDKSRAVFVKALPLVSAVHQRQFELEADMLHKMQHSNLLRFIGLSVDPCVAAAYFVYEYMPGNLKSFLLKMKDKMRIADASNQSRRSEDRLCMLVLSRQAANGLLYLHKQQVVHCDLRACNCLLSRRARLARRWPQLKLVPFATAVATNDSELERWLPPECLGGALPTAQANVWSMAVLIWEIFMADERPYGQFSDFDARQAIRDGVELEQPELTDYHTYSLLKACWRHQPGQRPDMHHVVEFLDSVVLKAAGTLKMFAHG